MQKKNLPDTSSSSSWQETMKNQQRSEGIRKYVIWAGIIALCVAGFVGLVYFVNKSSVPAPLSGRVEPNLPKVSVEDIVVGDPKATETITEYADMQCPACAAYNPVVNQVLENYKGKVKLVYRFFPLPQHNNAYPSAEAAYAAWKMDKFPEMKDKLFDNQKSWESLSDADARSKFAGYAKDLKLDQEKFKTLMNSPEAKAKVDAGKAEAASLGLNSTPTFFIGNKFVTPQSYQDFKNLIDADLKNK